MNRHINLRAAWLAPLALLVLCACGGGGSGESRSMEQVFADMEDVVAEAHSAIPNDVGFDDLDQDMLMKMSDFTGRIGDLYGELADVAPAEYRDQFGECAEFAHKGADAMKMGWAAVMSLTDEVEGDPEAACEKAMDDLGGPKMSAAT